MAREQRRCGVKSGVCGGSASREMGDRKWSLLRCADRQRSPLGTVFSQVWIGCVIRHSARHWNGSRNCRSSSIVICMIWAIVGRGQVITTSTPVWHTGHGRRIPCPLRPRPLPPPAAARRPPTRARLWHPQQLADQRQLRSRADSGRESHNSECAGHGVAGRGAGTGR